MLRQMVESDTGDDAEIVKAVPGSSDEHADATENIEIKTRINSYLPRRRTQ